MRGEAGVVRRRACARWCMAAVVTAAVTAGLPGANAAEADDAAETDKPLELTLDTCLEVGIQRSFELIDQEEAFILQELATALQRHNYGRLWTSTVAADSDLESSETESVSVDMAKRLLSGADLRLSLDSSGAQPGEDDHEYSSSVGLSIEQPLLRGAGRLVAREDLTQAERELIYAGRDLVLFRQEFLIDLVSKYYRLVQTQLEIENQRERVAGAEQLATRTVARHDTGTANPIDMLRAIVNLLRARNDLVDVQERFQLQLDSLKLDLDVPVDRPITLVPPDELPYGPRFAIELDLPPALQQGLRKSLGEADDAAPTDTIDARLKTKQAGRSIEEVRLESAAVALEHRLDLMTARSEAEDARRRLRVARNNLRGDLDLTARVGYSTEPAASFDDQRFGKPEWSVGLAYEVPLDRVAERTSYRQQLISLLRAERRANRVRDQVLLDVRNTLRDLHRSETTVLIQGLNVTAAQQRLRRAVADNEIGEITNRDVVEALNELVEARNALDRAKIDHIIATLQLRKDTGLLDPDRWREEIQ